MKDCSIIIPVYNQVPLTRQCLDALLAQSYRANFEIVVVDDASEGGMRRLLDGYGDRVRVVRHDRNRGFAVSCNDGAAAAEGRHLVFLNNDTIPLAGWLDALVDYAEAHPEAAIVGSKLLFPDGSIQHCGMVIANDRTPRHLYIGFPRDHPAVNTSRPFQLVTGGCFLIARDAFEAASGFDTAYRNGYEDVDLCLRLGAMGRQVHYCHESELYHLASMSEGRTNDNDRNARLYRERWADRVQPDDWSYYLEDGLIRIDYGHSTPLKMALSPLLAIEVDREGAVDEAERLLAARTHQVHDLMRTNLLLSLMLLRPPADLPELAAAGGDLTESLDLGRPGTE